MTSIQPSQYQSSIGPIMAYNHKQAGEKKRRALTNEKFDELKQLVVKEEDIGNNLTQEEILKKALAMGIQLRDSIAKGPYFRGFLNGKSKIIDLTISFLNSLEMSQEVTDRCVEDIQKTVRSNIFEIPPSTSTSPIVSEQSEKESGEEIRRKKHVERERERRNRLAATYDALQKFIEDNKLWNGKKKIEKIQIVETMIDFIRNGNGNQNMTAEEEVSFEEGRRNGLSSGESEVMEYFNKHLKSKAADLEKFINFQLNPVPFIGFPVTQNPIALPPVPLNTTTPLPLIPLNNIFIAMSLLLQQRSLLMPLQSPISAVFKSTATNFPVPIQDEKENTPMPKLKGIVRPWV